MASGVEAEPGEPAAAGEATAGRVSGAAGREEAEGRSAASLWGGAWLGGDRGAAAWVAAMCGRAEVAALAARVRPGVLAPLGMLTAGR